MWWETDFCIYQNEHIQIHELSRDYNSYIEPVMILNMDSQYHTRSVAYYNMRVKFSADADYFLGFDRLTQMLEYGINQFLKKTKRIVQEENGKIRERWETCVGVANYIMDYGTTVDPDFASPLRTRQMWCGKRYITGKADIKIVSDDTVLNGFYDLRDDKIKYLKSSASNTSDAEPIVIKNIVY